jgi:hypothetical protein
MVGRYLHHCEENGGGDDDAEDEAAAVADADDGGGKGGGGVRWDDVVTWYLEQQVEEIETEEQLDLEKDIVNKVR